MDHAGLEQHGAAQRHRQEEGEVDDDRVLAAIAQRIEPRHQREERRKADHRGGAKEAERQRHERQFGIAREHHVAVGDAPGDQDQQALEGIELHAARDREDVRREDVAGVEIDEARGEFVDRGPAGLDRQDLQRGRQAPHHRNRNLRVARELGDDEEDRQQVDEPQRAERLDEAFQIEQHGFRGADVGGDARCLERELDCHPEDIKISEVHDLAVQIGAPVAVDHVGKKQAGDHEEVGHAERLGERDHIVHPAFMTVGEFDAERRVHHHHEDDAEALGIVDPVDPAMIVQLGVQLRGGWCVRCWRCAGHDACP